MKQSLIKIKQEFESSSTRTPQYLDFHRTWKREFSKLLSNLGCTKIEHSKPNHFDVSGFFTDKKEQVHYFRLEDLRWSKDYLLIRTAKHYKDYTGGGNNYVRVTDIEEGIKIYLRCR